MFSNNRRQPTTRSKPVATTVTTFSSTSTAPASTGALPNAPSHARPPPSQVPTTIKVTTVRTKVQAPANPTRPTPLGSHLGSSSSNLKRRASGAATSPASKRSHDSLASPSNSRSLSNSPRPKISRPSPSKAASASRAKVSAAPWVKSRARPASSDSDDDDERGRGRGTTATAESSSEDEGVGIISRRDNAAVVKRDVSATEDGRVDVITAALLVENSRMRYDHHFVDLSDPARTPLDWAGAAEPYVMLEYPGEGASEKYMLLAPIGQDEFDPIDRLISVIKLIIETFLTPQQSLSYFNHSPSTSSFGAFLSAPSRSATPAPALGSSPGPSTPTASGSSAVPLIRALEKARAKKDGPGFVAEVNRYNAGLMELKASGAVKDNIAKMEGVADKVWIHVAQEVYERTVGPEIEKLKEYEPFTDYVYGELLPPFNSQIFKETGLGSKTISKEGIASSDSVFVDLGSGVGNVVIQAALATGAESWGFEYMDHAAGLAAKQVVEAEGRFRMWGLKGGKMRTVKADFCDCPEVGQVMKRADVVLVNNEVFTAPLNQRLSWLFLDLPSGAQIASLKAFAAGFKLSQYNCGSPNAIIDQGRERRYKHKSVSWKADGGSYFIARIDRRPLERFTKREETKRAGDGVAKEEPAQA